MVAGDLVVLPYQYEFNGLLMGSGTPYTVTGLEGLWALPEIRTADIERNDGHGDVPGEDLMGPRIMEAEITVTADTQTLMETHMLNIARAMRVRQDDIPLVWLRPGQAKKQVNCRPRRRSFPSKYEMARGIAEGMVQLYCPDPLIYANLEKTLQITLPAATASGSAVWANNGDFETWPKFTLQGAGSNPRFANQQAANRQVRIDLVMASGDTLVVDTHPLRRTVALNGVDRYDLVRIDNQWWELLEGNNTITFSRTATTGSQTLTVAARDTWA